jgi:hypothetical protein
MLYPRNLVTSMSEETAAACLVAVRREPERDETTLWPQYPAGREVRSAMANATMGGELASEFLTRNLARLAGPCLEMRAVAGAVPHARHHTRQLMQATGMKELAGTVELIVSEVVTNSVRACGGLDFNRPVISDPSPAIRLWLASGHSWVLVLVWDISPDRPLLQQPDSDAERGRGLLLIEAITAAWGSSALAGEPGKVVGACRD